MPIYEYECETCSSKFELLQSVSDKRDTFCPKCQGHSHRVFSPISYIWKGARFAGENISKSEECKPEKQSAKKPESNKTVDDSKKRANPRKTAHQS